MTRPESLLIEFAESAHGLVTGADRSAVHISPSAWHRAIADGRWVQVFPGVFRHRSCPPSASQYQAAALLAVPRSILSHETAASIYKLDGFLDADLDAPIHVLVKGMRGRQAVRGLVHHRTTWLAPGDQRHRSGLRYTSPARTIVDLAATIGQRALEDALDSAIRQRLLTMSAFRRYLDEIGAVGGVRKLRLVVGSTPGAGVHNRLERDFLGLSRRAGLPDPEPQKHAGRRRVDFWYESLNLVVETGGHGRHSSRSERAADAARTRELVAQGRTVIEFTSDEVFSEPARVVADLQRVARSVG